MTARPLFIGEAPSAIATNFEGRCGRRLAEVAGLDHETFCRNTVRANILPERDDPRRNDRTYLHARFDALYRRESPSTVVLVGRVACRGAGLDTIAPCVWYERDDGCWFVYVPHPSGRSRWWNDATNRDCAGRVIREAFDAG